MPRRSGGGMRSSSPSRAPAPRPTHTALTSHPPPPPVARQPGLFGQMAATAGGIAVGSAVGHTIGAALTGGHRDHDQSVAVQETTGPNSQLLYQGTDRCQLYQKEFIKCLDNANGDSKQCQGFWEALKECQQTQNANAY